MHFNDRTEAGWLLGEALVGIQDAVVFGMPRGGVVVASEVASHLGAPLDVVITRKIGHPANSEYAIGAVTEDGEALLNEAEAANFSEQWLARAIQREANEAKRRREKYVGDRPPLDIEGKAAVIVDDGIATGFTMLAAVRAIKKRGPAKIVVAAPVAPAKTIEKLKEHADEVVVLHAPGLLYAIGAYYEDFAPVSDRQVQAILATH